MGCGFLDTRKLPRMDAQLSHVFRLLSVSGKKGRLTDLGNDSISNQDESQTRLLRKDAMGIILRKDPTLMHPPLLHSLRDRDGRDVILAVSDIENVKHRTRQDPRQCSISETCSNEAAHTSKMTLIHVAIPARPSIPTAMNPEAGGTRMLENEQQSLASPDNERQS